MPKNEAIMLENKVITAANDAITDANDATTAEKDAITVETMPQQHKNDATKSGTIAAENDTIETKTYAIKS